MQEELRPPRECIVDLALLLENALEPGDDWCSGDQVMDVHHLKARLKEREENLDKTLAKVRLQGAALALTSLQRKELRRDLVDLIGVCMNMLQATELLDPSKPFER
jgi:ppGpp synthetase/RelA/SpoT-type nucleotidyltranferase